MASFFRKFFLIAGVAMILGVFSYVQMQDQKSPNQNLANNAPAQTQQDPNGQVLGASTSNPEENLCKYKNTTDSLPRGSEKVQDILCNR